MEAIEVVEVSSLLKNDERVIHSTATQTADTNHSPRGGLLRHILAGYISEAAAA